MMVLPVRVLTKLLYVSLDVKVFRSFAVGGKNGLRSLHLHYLGEGVSRDPSTNSSRDREVWGLTDCGFYVVVAVSLDSTSFEVRIQTFVRDKRASFSFKTRDQLRCAQNWNISKVFHNVRPVCKKFALITPLFNGREYLRGVEKLGLSIVPGYLPKRRNPMNHLFLSLLICQIRILNSQKKTLSPLLLDFSSFLPKANCLAGPQTEKLPLRAFSPRFLHARLFAVSLAVFVRDRTYLQARKMLSHSQEALRLFGSVYKTLLAF